MIDRPREELARPADDEDTFVHRLRQDLAEGRSFIVDDHGGFKTSSRSVTFRSREPDRERAVVCTS